MSFRERLFVSTMIIGSFMVNIAIGLKNNKEIDNIKSIVNCEVVND